MTMSIQTNPGAEFSAIAAAKSSGNDGYCNDKVIVW